MAILSHYYYFYDYFLHSHFNLVTLINSKQMRKKWSLKCSVVAALTSVKVYGVCFCFIQMFWSSRTCHDAHLLMNENVLLHLKSLRGGFINTLLATPTDLSSQISERLAAHQSLLWLICGTPEIEGGISITRCLTMTYFSQYTCWNVYLFRSGILTRCNISAGTTVQSENWWWSKYRHGS